MSMDIDGLLLFLAIGGIAGSLAGLFMNRRGFGLIGNVIVGIVGAFIGGYAVNFLGIQVVGGVLGAMLVALTGALILLWLAKKLS